jgi:putative colanic acid biosynthesis acetyltransferase WcaF
MSKMASVISDSPAADDSAPVTSNANFRNPHSLANKMGRVAWAIVYWTCYRWTPARMGGWWRRWLLSRFGARLGRAWFHPSVRIWAPWLLKAGDDVYVDRGCYLYNPYGIEIGDRVIISFDSVLCTPTHDYRQPDYPLCGDRIVIEGDSWIAARAFVSPGVTIARGAVVGACSVVTRDVPAWSVVGGNPAVVIKQRMLTTAADGCFKRSGEVRKAIDE